MAEGVVIPLWGKLVLIGVGKKALVLTTAYLYGVPRIYRRSQKLVRYVMRDPERRATLQGYLRTGFRLPAKLLHLEPKAPRSPAVDYLSMLPIRLLPAAKRAVPKTQELADAPKSASHRAYARLKTSFASSSLIQRPSASWTAGQAKIASLRERFSGSSTLQDMVGLRAQHAAEMWRKFKHQPYFFVPSIS